MKNTQYFMYKLRVFPVIVLFLGVSLGFSSCFDSLFPSIPEEKHYHQWSYFPAFIIKEPTCTEEGVGVKVCEVCGAKDTNTLPVAPLGHVYGEWKGIKKEATCTEEGEGTRFCEQCGKVDEITNEIPALGHEYGDWTETKAATCVEPGEETGKCIRDETHTAKRAIPVNSNAHKYPEEWTRIREPDCAITGAEKRVCEYSWGHEEIWTSPH